MDSEKKLFIPTKCKAGFNVRKETYTGVLAYVIAWNGKQWRKENSWEKWREKFTDSEEYRDLKTKKFKEEKERRVKWWEESKPSDWIRTSHKTLEDFLKYSNVDSIENFSFYDYEKRSTDEKVKVLEFDNTPTSGFVLNKKVGGYSSGWNHRSTYTRVYDPRGFEFEISIENLLFILQECNAYKGKGLEGEFVYSWSGKDLVLLPCSSEDYTSAKNFTKLQSKSLLKDNFKPGFIYKTKQLEDFVYLGNTNFSVKNDNEINTSKSHVFYSLKNEEFSKKDFKLFAEEVGQYDNYAQLVDSFNSNWFSSKLKEIVKRYEIRRNKNRRNKNRRN